jgi:hypothetical protein
MNDHAGTDRLHRATRIGLRVAQVMSIVTILLLGAALLVPLRVATPSNQGSSMPATEADARLPVGLLEKIAGRRHLIRAALVQAAVRDNGAAQKLLATLKLQGVIRIGSQYVAYVAVDKGGTATVHQGDSLSRFMVDKIEPGHLLLSLDGVTVTLGH